MQIIWEKYLFGRAMHFTIMKKWVWGEEYILHLITLTLFSCLPVAGPAEKIAQTHC